MPTYKHITEVFPVILNHFTELQVPAAPAIAVLSSLQAHLNDPSSHIIEWCPESGDIMPAEITVFIDPAARERGDLPQSADLDFDCIKLSYDGGYLLFGTASHRSKDPVPAGIHKLFVYGIGGHQSAVMIYFYQFMPHYANS